MEPIVLTGAGRGKGAVGGGHHESQQRLVIATRGRVNHRQDGGGNFAAAPVIHEVIASLERHQSREESG